MHCIFSFDAVNSVFKELVFYNRSEKTVLIKRPLWDACLHMGGILAEGSAGSAVSAGSEIFPLSKNDGDFEFLTKMVNLKLLISPKPCKIERFR